MVTGGVGGYWPVVSVEGGTDKSPVYSVTGGESVVD